MESVIEAQKLMNRMTASFSLVASGETDPKVRSMLTDHICQLLTMVPAVIRADVIARNSGADVDEFMEDVVIIPHVQNLSTSTPMESCNESRNMVADALRKAKDALRSVEITQRPQSVHPLFTALAHRREVMKPDSDSSSLDSSDW